MIKIGFPYLCQDDNNAFLKAKVEISKDTVDSYIALRTKLPKTHWRTAKDYPPLYG